MLLFAVATTILYFEQANLVRRFVPDNASRLTFFATLDLIGNSLTLAMAVW
jgi:AAA family ATP:ADP antiporter